MVPSSHIPVKLSIFPQEFLEVKYEFSLMWGCVQSQNWPSSLPVPMKTGQAMWKTGEQEKKKKDQNSPKP